MDDTPTSRPPAGTFADPAAIPEHAKAAVTVRAMIVVELLADLRRKVEWQPDEKVRRSLLRRIESLQYVVDWWHATPPPPDQISAMLDVLLRVQEASDRGRPLALI